MKPGGYILAVATIAACALIARKLLHDACDDLTDSLWLDDHCPADSSSMVRGKTVPVSATDPLCVETGAFMNCRNIIHYLGDSHRAQ